ncbi:MULTISPECIES: hypothetical protein [unclassified Streptomyces]|uniref:hypothetical protein n=1 Tax=unclassified Streptomyces TaxID=2593676 RepID=UPI002E237B81|nr:hypothetical protein OG217_06465 [Streptomyces sp. NBC_01023]
MAGSGPARRRGIARLPALCAVLFGLFLMHGAPATAAAGCHGAMSAPAGMHEGPHATQSRTAPVMTHPGVQQASGSAAMDGATCVSTPARDTVPLTTPALPAVVAVLASLFLAGRTLAPGRTRRRGPPPPGGRSLLLHVCIART